MNTKQLRMLARLMFEWEFLRAINWRDHNPVCRSISDALEARVNCALGFDCAPAFSSKDDLYEAILKSSRHRIIAESLHSAIVDTIGFSFYEQITSRIRKVLDGELMRLIQRLGIKANGFWGFLLLAGHYTARRIQRRKSLLLRQFRNCRQTWIEQQAFWKEYAVSMGNVRRDSRPVMIVIGVGWPQLGYSSGKIIKELRQAGTPVCCLLADGFNPKTSSVIPHGWDWLHEVEVISLPQVPYPLWDLVTRLLIPEVPKRYRTRGLRKFPSASGIRFKFNRHSREFVFASNCADFLLESIRPRSVLNMMGDKNIYGQAISYNCVKSGIAVHSYSPFIFYPNGIQPTRPTPSTLVVSKLDIPQDESAQAGRSFVVVGSPLFDDPVPSDGEVASERPQVLRLIYLTKRVFPNLEVITQIQQALDQFRGKFHLILKPHPSDTESDYQNVLSLLQRDQVTYVGAEEVESVERWIAKSDVVITGPSNVIWSALRQKKPMIYLNFTGVGDDHYPEAYGRYAAAPFVTAWAVSEVGEALRRILRETDGGRAPVVDGSKIEALIEDVFHGGGGSARRIAALLTQAE